MENSMRLEFNAYPENESFARLVIAAYMTELDPTIEEMEDVKTAVSEAVTNCIIHGYEMTTERIKKDRQSENAAPVVYMEAWIRGRTLHIKIKDEGVGIENIEKAMEPLYTSKPELDRSGMGFAFMEAFMDEIQVESAPGAGTTIYLKKKIGCV